MRHRLTILFALWSFFTFGQVITPFSIRYQTTQKGGIRYISNTAVTCNGGGGCGTAQAQNPPAGNGYDNNFTAAYTDIDGDGTTFQSSSDSLALPLCSEISWAGLYWGGEMTAAGAQYAVRNQCRIKVNNGAYQNLTASALQDNTVGFNTYHCFLDVTSIVQAAGVNARFTVANVAARVGGTNRFGGWTIVIVYKNDLQPTRNLTVFNGLSNVSAANPNTDITVSGFLTPVSGPVTFEVGDVTYDGDRSLTGDQLLFNGGSGFVNISDADNNANDIFNSTLCYNGIAKTAPFINPGFLNTLGYDADIFLPNNAALNYIGNSANTATLRLTTAVGGETYLTQVVTMAIDVYEPDLRAAVRALDINGGLVQPGDTIEYTIVGKNIGSDPSINTFITDTLEPNAIYVPGSLRITSGPNIGAKTDAAADDQGEYDAALRYIKVRIGTGANGTTGGTVLNSPLGVDSTQIKFRVTATADCIILLCDNVVNARAYIFGTGNVSGNPWSNGSNPDIFDGFGCPIAGTTTTPIQAAICPAVTASSNSPVCTGGTINLSLSSTSTYATYSWTGPAAFTSTLASPSRTGATGAMAGTYTCVITVGVYACSYTVTTTVAVNAPPTAAAAGPDQVICSTAGSATMAGNTPGVGTGAWSQISGPVSATITTPASPSTIITGMTTPGTYVYQWTITSTCANSTDQVQVTVNAPPTVSAAGTDASVCGLTATFAGNTPATGTGTWTQVAGPGTSVFSNANSPTSNVTVSVVGAYTFRWTIANSPCTASQDNVIITFVATPTTSNAGPDQTICTTSGSATMNANNPAAGTGTWTQVSGPITATITNPLLRTTTITGMTTAGTYTFQWTITNAPCAASSDQVVITVNAPPTASNAGPDASVCGLTATLAGNTPATGTGTWTLVAGPGTASFSNANSPASNVTVSVVGAYTFRWTIANAPCTASQDNVIITFVATPTTSNAGPDQTICTTGGSATMNANNPAAGTGAWTQVSGPVAATITNPLLSTTTITGMTTAGTYTFQWTITNAPCAASSDQVVVTVNAPPTASAAGSDSTVCGLTMMLAGNTPVTGTGTWTLVAGPGTASFSNANSPTSNVTVSVVGAYTFRWTIANAPCTASQDNVIMTFLAAPATSNAGPDDSICGLAATLAGNTPVTGTGAWTLISGPGTATFTNAALANSDVTVSASGVYTFQWTISNAPCSPSQDNVDITFVPAPTTAAAGGDQAVCGLTAVFTGNTAAAGTGTWIQISGPGTSSFSNANSETATVTVTVSGTYVYEWTIANAPCVSSSDQVQITYSDIPTVSAGGSDQSVCGLTATLAANTASAGTGGWSMAGGPGTITFTNSASPVSDATASVFGTYALVWTISNAPCASSTDTVLVTFVDNPTTASAGMDSVNCGLQMNLYGNVPTVGTGTWTVISGPGTVSFTNANAANTSATVTIAGTYVLEWTIFNASPCAASADQATITFQTCDHDGDGIPDNIDVDDDNDGILDTIEGSADTDGDGIPDYFDLDSDNDGITDVIEAGGTDADGDGIIDGFTDLDGDGLSDNVDPSQGGTPLPVPDTDGDGIPDYLDLDSDNDGITDVIEAGGTDANGDGIIDGFTDADNDGLSDNVDPTQGGTPLPTPDSDGDGIADYLDLDSDNDGITDVTEAGGTDTNGDGIIDGFADADNDGLSDNVDPTQGGTPLTTPDTDGDGIANYLDVDSDNDGITDVMENGGADANGDGQIDGYADTDGDGLSDNVDPDNGGTPLVVGNMDGDSAPNYLDIDSDNDGITDIIETGGTDANGDGMVDNFTDTDNDGQADSVDPNNGGTPNTSTGADTNNDGRPDSYPNDNADGSGNMDYLDIDADDDGIVDNIEGQSTSGYIPPTGNDTDGDGLDDAYDANSGFGGAGVAPVNTDGTDAPDYLDTDTDNDGVSDLVEGNDFNNDGQPDTQPSGNDTDGDGLDDAYDNVSVSGVNNVTNNDGPPTGTTFPNLDNSTTSELDWREQLDWDNDGIGNVDDIDDDNDGITDVVENATASNGGDTDGDGIPDQFDLDSDNDGMADVIEAGGPDPDNDGIVGTGPITDANSDGLNDAQGPNGLTPPDFDGDGNPDFQDLDSDNDGISDLIESGRPSADDANSDGVLDGPDSDNDGILDQADTNNGGSFVNAPPDTDGDSHPDYTDLDSDNDGINDIIESGNELADANSDGVVDGADTDDDGIMDAADGSSSYGDAASTSDDPTDTDGDNVPDYQDLDSDNDGIDDIIEAGNMALDANSDGIVDGIDTDNDGIIDAADGSNGTYGDAPSSSDDPVDTDNDGVPDYQDLDADNDGIDDVIEGGNGSLDANGDGIVDGVDTDGDGIIDSVDGSNGTFGDAPTTGDDPADTDGDGIPDYQDLDSDGDGISDVIEGGNGDLDTNGDGVIDGVDTDGDGIIDSVDGNNGTWGDAPGAGSDTPPDTDGDGTPNYIDLDSDGDGISDGVNDEIPAEDCDGDGTNNYLDPDPCDLVIPQGFSVNGDGINDYFEIKGITAYPDNTITIFNRWGNIVYEAAGYNNGSVRWDGANSNKLSMGNGFAPEGTYFYVLDLGNGSPVKSGYVYLNTK
ncbi:MAG: hypothetical protein FD123_3930 [Bacteroidetes bacterium]|nr:MAG: hypothetical protein FD123_3930 [Bacteroidota bacterium]